MDEETKRIIKKDKYIYRLLREDSSHYKYLYKDKNYIKELKKLSREKYKVKLEDRLEKLNNNIELVNMFLDALK